MAILSLMRDLYDLPGTKLDPPPEGEDYSTYSMGILFGILAVALYLSVAIIASANLACASHCSFHPPQKEVNFEGRIICCMIVLLGTAIMSGGSLISLSTDIELFFAACVGLPFLSGVVISMYHILTWFGLGLTTLLLRIFSTKKSILTLSLTLSTMAFSFTVTVASGGHTMWFTVIIYYITVTYQLLVLTQSISHKDPCWSITFTFTLCVMWLTATASSIGLNHHLSLFAMLGAGISGLETLLLACIGIFGAWKERKRRRRLRHIRVPTEPV